MARFIKILCICTMAAVTVLSFGYVDPNMVLSTNSVYEAVHAPLFQLVYYHRPYMTGLFFLIIVLLFVCYLYAVKHADTVSFSKKKVLPMLVGVVLLLVFSYPALSYDLFNYMTTAKVAFTHHENPYLIMPIEIANEPYLAFTRAANKVALYGPVWILITAIPHAIGSGSIWGTIIAYKLLSACMYAAFILLIWKMTQSWKNVLFFALNPLMLIEVLLSGHNDIYMMVFATLGILLWERKGVGNKVGAILSFIASFLIKGATVVLVPLLFVKNISRERMLLLVYYGLSAVFFIVAPLREELYPWYAVWLVATASLLDMKKHALLIGVTVVLTFALELRHLPYMWMGYYEGPGPLLRTLLTVIPVGMYIVYVGIRHLVKKGT